ncbi:hypothetical protein [Weissella minor]|uniref:hypothetical protein n=1 Tax=Weissella minor TaxID=1620 RepID=UPI003AF25C8E
MMTEKDTYHLIVLDTFQNVRSELMFDGQLVNANTNDVIPVRMFVDNIFGIQNQIIKNVSLKKYTEQNENEEIQPISETTLTVTKSDKPDLEEKVMEEIEPSDNLKIESSNVIDEEPTTEMNPPEESKEEHNKVVRSHRKRLGLRDVHSTVTQDAEGTIQIVNKPEATEDMSYENEEVQDNEIAESDGSDHDTKTTDSVIDEVSDQEEVRQVVDPFSNVAITADTEVELDDRTAEAVIADMKLNDADEQRRQFGVVAE